MTSCACFAIPQLRLLGSHRRRVSSLRSARPFQHRSISLTRRQVYATIQHTRHRLNARQPFSPEIDMAEDYQRAQAEAAALQQALAARRASVIPAPHKVALPMPVSVPGHNNRTTRQMKTALGPDPMHKTQVRAQHYMARAHPLLPRAHSQPVPVRSAQQPLQPVQHVRHVSPASLPALPMPMPIRGPTPVYERVHGLSQLEAQTYDNVKGHTVSTGTGTGTSSISAAASAHNAAPAPAPYRQPTMQDLPLIKPQPRPPGSFGESLVFLLSHCAKPRDYTIPLRIQPIPLLQRHPNRCYPLVAVDWTLFIKPPSFSLTILSTPLWARYATPQQRR